MNGWMFRDGWAFFYFRGRVVMKIKIDDLYGLITSEADATGYMSPISSFAVSYCIHCRS